MPSIQVRDLPEDLYKKLIRQAKKEHRSLAQETIAILEKGLNSKSSKKDKRKETIKLIKSDDILEKEKLSSPIDLIREDRTR